MNAFVRIEKYKDTEKGTDLIISVPIKGLGEVLSQKKIKDAEIRLDDGRHISTEQCKKAYATIRDIASYTGYLPEEQKEWLKYLHIMKTGCGYFYRSSLWADPSKGSSGDPPTWLCQRACFAFTKISWRSPDPMGGHEWR